VYINILNHYIYIGDSEESHQI